MKSSINPLRSSKLSRERNLQHVLRGSVPQEQFDDGWVPVADGVMQRRVIFIAGSVQQGSTRNQNFNHGQVSKVAGFMLKVTGRRKNKNCPLLARHLCQSLNIQTSHPFKFNNSNKKKKKTLCTRDILCF